MVEADGVRLDSRGNIAISAPLFAKLLTHMWQSQRDWFLEESRRIHPIERPFTPDGAKDVGGVWRARNDTEKTLAKPNALVFFHIPL